jgi:uncharacterized membrane protein YjfL (UPF0719 family)
MSGDEVFVTIGAIGLGPIAWIIWLWRLSAISRLSSRRSHRGALALVLIVCAALIHFVTHVGGSFDVRDSPIYLFMYLVLGLAWIRLGEWLSHYAGLHARDDVVERGNGAAVPAVSGALLGLSLCYAGANIGDGPGWWVVVFAAAIATVALFGAWLLVDRWTRLTELVTVDRDRAAGFRLAGFLVACGVVFGRAVAGDWVSAPATIYDFVAVAWPAAALIAVAVLVERAVAPSAELPATPVVTLGLVPALVYAGAAILYVMTLGVPA